MTPDITKIGTDFIHAMSGRSQDAYYYSFRLEAGAKASKGAMPAASGTGDVVMKLRREGILCYVSYSLDGGATFGSEKKNEIPGLPDTVYVGLAVNSANNETTGTAVFSSFEIDGSYVSF